MEGAIKALYPTTLFPSTFVPPAPYAGVQDSYKPEHNRVVEYLKEVAPVNVDGVWRRQYEPTPLKEETIAKNLEAQKRLKQEHIIRDYEAALGPLEAAYPQKERETWPQQVTESLALIANAAADAPLVNSMLTPRGKNETALELAEKIIVNYTAFSSIVGAALGTMQARQEALNAIDLGAVDAIDHIEAV